MENSQSEVGSSIAQFDVRNSNATHVECSKCHQLNSDKKNDFNYGSSDDKITSSAWLYQGTDKEH